MVRGKITAVEANEILAAISGILGLGKEESPSLPVDTTETEAAAEDEGTEEKASSEVALPGKPNED